MVGTETGVVFNKKMGVVGIETSRRENRWRGFLEAEQTMEQLDKVKEEPCSVFCLCFLMTMTSCFILMKLVQLREKNGDL